MNRQIRSLAKSALQRIGKEDEVKELLAARTAQGRRGLRDDRQLAFFLAATLTPDANCVDVGAHSGSVLRQIERLSPDGQHVAVEPIPHLAEALRVAHPNVEVLGVALSNEPGVATFNVANLPELSGLQQREWLGAEYEQVTIPVQTLDNVIPDRKVDFIKVDVEGAQVRVLQGADRILGEYQPPIWVEHGNRSAETYGTTSRDLWDLLVERYRYRLWTVDGDGPLDWAGFSATDHQRLWTFMAHR